jgi:hypothetical protein
LAYLVAVFRHWHDIKVAHKQSRRQLGLAALPGDEVAQIVDTSLQQDITSAAAGAAAAEVHAEDENEYSWLPCKVMR